MAPVITRLNLSQPISEQLDISEDLCVITKESLELLITETLTERKRANDINEGISKALNLMATNFDALSGKMDDASLMLATKLDSLIETISTNNTIITSSITSSKTPRAHTVDSQINKRNQVYEKNDTITKIERVLR